MEKKLKFNFVDAIIIILVLAVFVLGVSFVKKGVSSTVKLPEVSFTMEVKEAPEGYKDNFAVGDKIRDAVKGDKFGVVTEIKAVPASNVSENSENGTYVVSEYEGREDVYITIKGTPAAIEPDVMMAQQKVKIGKMVYIKNNKAVGRGFVVAMEIDGQEAEGND